MNRLADETSPYLRQHRDNPVDWFPWGPEAFALAAAQDRPVLLSVGYSACHWCHVMAHESFEDGATAAVMNDLFVSIKVDREERPDVDAVYMEAVQALTGQGGWPMTVFLFPDGRPFFGGTYFPPRAGRGRPSFTDLLQRVDQAWRTQRGELEDQAEQLASAIRERTALPAAAGAAVSPRLVEAAAHALLGQLDPAWGGFGRAPKFPQPSHLELLLRHHAHAGDEASLAAVTTTLDAMASGGIYDHLGGGFARYSTDDRWLVPHFEKMLYDQAGLVRAYVHGWQVTGSPAWRQVAEETVDYVLRDLGQAAGGFSSAEDADSDGVEGRFYVWSYDEALAVGGEVAVDWYGVTPAGNFEGSTILTRPVRGDLVRPAAVEAARRDLFDARSTRVRPALDDKAITEWNAMWISTLAEAGAAFGRRDWLDRAEAGAEFLLRELRLDGRWRRSWQADGGARHLAFAIDHAWLVDAFTRLGEATGRRRWTDEAVAAADELLRLFWDDEGGGVFTTGIDGERLIVRAKDTYDGATPSASSVAALALVRLGALTGDARFTDHGIRTLGALGDLLHQHPVAFTQALAAADIVASGTTEVVVAGDRPDLVAAVQAQYLPNAVLAWGEPAPTPLWEGRAEDVGGRGRAYVCRGYACLLPVGDVASLLEQLDGRP